MVDVRVYNPYTARERWVLYGNCPHSHQLYKMFPLKTPGRFCGVAPRSRHFIHTVGLGGDLWDACYGGSGAHDVSM